MPYIVEVLSVDGFLLEITFSEEVTGVSASNPANYTLTQTYGAPATILSVNLGPEQPGGGYLTVHLVTSGTTLGGVYDVAAPGVQTVSGPMISPASVTIITIGDQTQVFASAI